MAYASLPSDQSGREIQALSPTTNGTISIGAASARVAVPAGCDVVRLAASCNCYIKFGDSAVAAAATDHVFPTGAEVMKLPAGVTHIAAIQLGAVTGTLSISAMV